ncbi:quattro [Engraulis encrasicolus]|uniref:quattro n=1 Tax=Engraulis encrasicolus TaxID=184585 RepID=UPI002FD526AE
MNPSSLDWSIQSALSSLFPPFEATAPTVLSQLFRTIEERYHGDALHCLLDFLIPAKHILESVQQAACAAYSDVVFRCEGWPLCLRDRVVIQLAPINPLLLRPGDFYLQVEPFGEQAARIILKSLLVQEEGLVDQQQAGGFGSRLSLESGVGLGVEETPIPETSYPCIFTQAWLEEVNEGRHGASLRTCVLSSDQGVVKVPWSEIVNPEFLDRPKSRIHSAAFMTDAMLAQGVFPPPSPSSSATLPLPTAGAAQSQSSVQSDLSSLTMETVILPAKDGIAVSLRLTGGNPKLVKADQHHHLHHHHHQGRSNPSGKPVGWVAPNTWDTRHTREMEGEYVDLVEFNKEKEALALAALSKLPLPPPAPAPPPVTPRPSQKGVRPVRPAPPAPAPAPAPKRDNNHTTTPAVQVQAGCSPNLPAELLSSPYSNKGPIPLTLELEAKNRHRESYLAALMNPVTFEGTLAPLEESGTDAEELGGLGPGGREAALGHEQPTPQPTRHHHHPSSPPLVSLSEREGGGGSPRLLRHLGPAGRPCVNANCGCPNKCTTGTSAGQVQQALQYTHQHQPALGGQSQDDLQKGHGGGHGQKFPKTQMLHKLGQQCKPHASTGVGLGTGLASQGQSRTELEGAHPNNHHNQHHHHNQTPLVAKDPCLAKHPRAPLQSQAPQQAPWPLTPSPTKTPPLRRMAVTTAGLCPNGPAAAVGVAGVSGGGNGGITAITGGLGAMALAEILRGGGGGGGGGAKGRTKQHSLSSVSDSAHECLQAQAQAQAQAQNQGRTPGGRSLSDICPEIIPSIRVIQNKKTTAFGLVSPKLDRKAQSKQAKKDPGTPPAPAGGLDHLLQTSGDQQPAAAQGRQPVPGPRVPACPLFKPYSPDSITLLPLAIACLPGSRDRAGRAVLEVHGERRGWTCPLVTSVELCKLLLYLHSLPRKEIRDLGLTLVVDARRSPPPPVFYKSLLMLQEQALHAVHGVVVLVDKDGNSNSRPERHTGLQMDVVTSLKALHKIVDGQQLTSDLGGTFLYNHSDWLHFHQKMAVFMTDLQGASTLLQKAIKKLDSVRKMDTVTDVKVCIEEQRSSMKEVLEDTRLVTLQREGGAILARMRKEEFRFAQSEDYRDSMEAMRSLYNQVEERVHMLVMRSNQSLTHLDHLLQLRTMEDNITTIREWFSSQEQSWRREEMMKEVNSSEDTLERVEQRLAHLTSFLGQAKERKAQADALVREAERIQRASFPEADVFRALVNTLQTDLAESLSRAQQSHAQLETTARLYRFCEQAVSLAMEVSQYLDQAGSGCYPGQQRGNSATLRAFEERLRAGFSPERFQQAKEEALALGSPAGMRRWGTAWARCQDVSQKLHRRLQTASSSSFSSSSSSSPPLSSPSSKDNSPKQVASKGGEKGDGGERGVERPVGEGVITNADGTIDTANATAASLTQCPTATEEMVAASEAPTLQFKESDRKGGGGGVSVGAPESRDSRARRLQDEEVTITCFNLHFNKADGKGKKASNGGCGSGSGMAPLSMSPKHTVEDGSDVSSSVQPQSPTSTNASVTESQGRASPPLSPLTSQSEAASQRSSPATAPSSPAKASAAPSFASLPDEIEGKVSTLPPLSPPQPQPPPPLQLPPPASSGAQTPHLPWAAAAALGKASKAKPLAKPSRWWRGVGQRGGEHHRSSHSQSEDDLRRMDEPAHHDHHPPSCHRALGRSHSEGSCVSLCVGGGNTGSGSGIGSGSGAQRGSSFCTRHTDATSARGVFGSRSSTASTSSSIPPQQHHQYSHHPYHQHHHHPLLHLSSSTPHHLGHPGQSTPTPYRRRVSEDHRGGGGGVAGWMEELHSSSSRLEDQNGSASVGPSIDPAAAAAAAMACGLETPKLGRAAQCEDTGAGNGSNNLKLQRIMEELLLTEREYVRALGYVMEHYFPQLERPDVPQDLRGQRGSIFGNLEKLRDFHQHHFLQELEQCLREPFRVGHCFLKHKDSFSLYALYSKNKPRSDNLLKHHGHFFKQKQLELGDKMDLSSYLLKPVQRISKYSLLLQDMGRECGPEPLPGAASASASPSASGPAAAAAASSSAAVLAARSHQRSQIQAALEVIHFQLRHGNNLLAMDDIQDCDVNLKEQGQLIRQDEFLVSFRKKKCYRHIFLFQDLILFSKTKKTEVGNDVYIYKQSFKTSDIGMTHNCGESGLCYEIWFRRRKSQDTYTLQAASAEVKRGWTRDLERILWEQAIHNREVRMQERVFMGIGYKPFMDIQPSEAAISDRAINCGPGSRECKASVSGVPGSSPGRFPALRPNSVRRTSSSGSHSSSSSSSSGRGSMSPVGGYLCPIGGPPAMGHGGLPLALSLPLSTPGVMEEDDMDPEQRNHHVLVDSSESSGESVSGFSSSGRSCLSVIGGEVEVEDGTSEGPSEVSPKTQTPAPTQRGPQEPTDGPPSSVAAVALAPTQTPLVSPAPLASPLLVAPTLLPLNATAPVLTPPSLAQTLSSPLAPTPAAISRIRDHPLSKDNVVNLTGKSTEV